MNYKKLLAGFGAGLLLCVQMGIAAAAVPQDAPKDIKHLLGLYYGNGENILIRENGGRLELLYRFSAADKDFSLYNIYPLAKEHFDAYLLNEVGPMSGTEAKVRFERDADGYGIACRVGGHTYSRYFLGQGVGERAEAFRFPAKSPEEWAQLRDQSIQAVMPAGLAAGEAVELVEAATVAGLHIQNVYAGSGNCFGAPLYTSSKLYVGKDAAAALAGVQQQLAKGGYGLILWDAYRPWRVSKLAHLALPEKQKAMLEDPDLKGSTHNTGNAVDVGLYDLASGQAVELTSSFDEPSPRQYAAYAGGTSRQRYLRNMLREAMEQNGFRGIDMEWWHFEYGDVSRNAHLNI